MFEPTIKGTALTVSNARELWLRRFNYSNIKQILLYVQSDFNLVELKPHAKFYNPMWEISNPKERERRRKEKKKKLNSGHLVPWQCTQAAWTKRHTKKAPPPQNFQQFPGNLKWTYPNIGWGHFVKTWNNLKNQNRLNCCEIVVNRWGSSLPVCAFLAVSLVHHELERNFQNKCH